MAPAGPEQLPPWIVDLQKRTVRPPSPGVQAFARENLVDESLAKEYLTADTASSRIRAHMGCAMLVEADLAALTGISAKDLGEILDADRDPTPDALRRLCITLRADPQFISTGKPRGGVRRA